MYLSSSKNMYLKNWKDTTSHKSADSYLKHNNKVYTVKTLEEKIRDLIVSPITKLLLLSLLNVSSLLMNKSDLALFNFILGYLVKL